MLAGVVTTLVAFAVTAILARNRTLAILARTERLRWKIGKTMEVASAGAVVALGVLMLMGQFGRV